MEFTIQGPFSGDMMGAFLGVAIIRIVVFGGLYWALPI